MKPSRLPTVRQPSALRKQQFAHAALQLIGEQGLAALNMVSLARRVGLVPSAIYRHFPGKQQVLDAVLELIGRRLQGHLAEVGAGRGSSLKRLRELLLRHADMIAGSPGIPRVVFSGQALGEHPRRRRRMYQIVSDYLDGVMRIIQAGQCDGEIRAGLDPATAARMFLGILQPAAFLQYLGDGQFNVRRHVLQAWRLFVAATAAEGVTHESQENEWNRKCRTADRPAVHEPSPGPLRHPGRTGGEGRANRAGKGGGNARAQMDPRRAGTPGAIRSGQGPGRAQQGT